MKSLPFVACLVVTTSILGCADPRYDRTEVTQVVSPNGGQLSVESIVLPMGSVLTGTITSYDEKGSVMKGDILIEDPSILELHPVFNSPSVAFFGVKAGSTKVSFVANGVVVRTLSGTVVTQ